MQENIEDGGPATESNTDTGFAAGPAAQPDTITGFADVNVADFADVADVLPVLPWHNAQQPRARGGSKCRGRSHGADNGASTQVEAKPKRARTTTNDVVADGAHTDGLVQ